MYALAYKQAAVAKQLLNTTNLRAVNAQNWTALDWAIHAELTEIATALKSQGLTTTRKATVSESAMITLPLMHANNNDLYRGWPDLAIAASRSSSELMSAALKSANINTGNANGETALMIAVKSNNVQQVEQLLNAGASIAVTEAMLETPLSWAVRHDQYSIVQALLNKGANASARGRI